MAHGTRDAWSLFGKGSALALALGLACGAVLPWLVGWWLDFSDELSRSDIIVVLCGGEYSRAVYAANLYREGWAPELWLVRPRPPESIVQAAALGLVIPNEDEVFARVLRQRGVPARALKRYGEDVVSTRGEAEALKRAYPTEGKKLLLVTSRYHARRAKLVFQRVLPSASVRVVASPYDSFNRRWWQDRTMVWAGFLELTKTVCFLTECPFAKPGPKPVVSFPPIKP